MIASMSTRRSSVGVGVVNNLLYAVSTVVNARKTAYILSAKRFEVTWLLSIIVLALAAAIIAWNNVLMIRLTVIKHNFGA